MFTTYSLHFSSVLDYNKYDENKDCGENLVEATRLMTIHIFLSTYNKLNKPSPILIGVLIDNPNANKKMQAILEEDEDCSALCMVPYGCVCHSFNNFGKDITKLGTTAKILAERRR